jgi:DNA-binding winged helix-turn-helix (wHTH) protein
MTRPRQGSGGGRLTTAVTDRTPRPRDRVSILTWGAFRLDLSEQRIFKEGRELHLRSKPFSILRYLAGHPRRLLTRAELVEAVWGKVAMSESVLRTHLWELRRVLGENVVETVVGRGYRFVADVDDVVRSSQPAERANVIVGRTIEMGVLRKALQDVCIGRRSLAFVSGEPGAGKSTLVDAFLDEASAQSSVWIARCVCLERCADVEPFQPLLEALGTMCRGSLGSSALEVLARHAPTVVAQMPALLDGRREDELRRRVAGAGPTRMLRELTEALEALSNESPLVLAIDDLQWADPATIDLIASLGSRYEPSRLLVVATFRSGAATQAHRLTRMIAELVAHRRGIPVALAGFDEQAIAEYLTARFGIHRFPVALASTVHSMTGGNPLFIASLFDDLEKDGLLRRDGEGWQLMTGLDGVAAQRPDTIRRFVDAQLDRLDAVSLQLLAMAATAGRTFAVGPIARALNENVSDIEARCEGLVRQRLLVAADTEGDGTAHDRFAFAHGFVWHTAAARMELSCQPTYSGALGGGALREDESNEKLLVVDEGADEPVTIAAFRARGNRSARVSAVPDDPPSTRAV